MISRRILIPLAIAATLLPLLASAQPVTPAPVPSVEDITGIPAASPTTVKLNTIISNILGFAFGLLIVLAALFIVVAAYLYLTSGGSQEKLATAHKFIVYAVVALVAGALSQTIVLIVRTLVGV